MTPAELAHDLYEYWLEYYDQPRRYVLLMRRVTAGEECVGCLYLD